jgi:hypothetical protein
MHGHLRRGSAWCMPRHLSKAPPLGKISHIKQCAADAQRWRESAGGSGSNPCASMMRRLARRGWATRGRQGREKAMQGPLDPDLRPPSVRARPPGGVACWQGPAIYAGLEITQFPEPETACENGGNVWKSRGAVSCRLSRFQIWQSQYSRSTALPDVGKAQPNK